MKKIYIDYICSLHGYLIRLKEIHWNTDKNGEHILCDEMMDELAELEDEFAECAMGLEGKHFKLGDLEPYVPNAEKLTPMLKELEAETLKLHNELKSQHDMELISILDDIVNFCNKYKYRSTQV